MIRNERSAELSGRKALELEIVALRPVSRLTSHVSRLTSCILLLAVFGCAAIKPADLVWPLPPEKPRIKFLESIQTTNDIERPSIWKRLSRLITGKRTVARLAKPYAVHMDRRGRLLVTDSAYPALLIFDMKNHKFSLIGLEGPGVLAKPMGVTTDSTGRIYVTDTVQNRAVVYDADGNFLMAMGRRGRFIQPVGIAVNEALNRVYIVDTKKHNISVFDREEGKFLFEIGRRGVEDGEFNWPTNIAIDKKGRLYVMDTFNFRVQVLNADGKFQKKLGGLGTALGHFAKPKGIGIDSEGNIYVADAAFSNVQIFNQEGQLLLFFGGFGNKPGQLWLPAGMYIDHEDKIYVADQYNHRINIYQFLGKKYQADQMADVQRK